MLLCTHDMASCRLILTLAYFSSNMHCFKLLWTLSWLWVMGFPFFVWLVPKIPMLTKYCIDILFIHNFWLADPIDRSMHLNRIVFSGICMVCEAYEQRYWSSSKWWRTDRLRFLIMYFRLESYSTLAWDDDGNN